MLVLALETSTPQTSVALVTEQGVIASVVRSWTHGHAEIVAPTVEHLLRWSEVDLGQVGGVAVGLGPGLFTGLRVGVVTARVLASVAGVELRGVCSLDVLAAQFARQSPPSDFVVATDARRREVYWAAYHPDGRRRTGPAVSPPADVPRRPAVGPAVDLYPDHLLATPGPRALDPGMLAVRGPGLPDAGREPLYLRRPDAAEPTRRKSVLPTAARSA